MGNQTFGIPAGMARTLVDNLGLVGAVETGTNQGNTARLLSTMVPRVWTIELSEVLAREAKERHRDAQGITFLVGDSAKLMAQAVDALDGPTLFWLDAHYLAGDDSAGFEAQCPLIEEIDVIDRSPAAARSALLIDDAEIFLGGPPPGYRRSDFPTLVEIIAALRAHHDRYVTILEDVIVAIPQEGQAPLERYWQDELARRERERLNSVAGRVKQGARAVLPAGVYERLRNTLR